LAGAGIEPLPFGSKECYALLTGTLFIKRAICSHSLAYSNLLNFNWFGALYSNKSAKIFTKTKRGRKAGIEKRLLKP